MNKVAVFSVPRSGSTWLGQIINSSPDVVYRFQPNFAYSFPLTLSNDCSHTEIEQFYKELLETKDDFVTGKIGISGKKNKLFSKSTPKLLAWKEVHFLSLAKPLLERSDTSIVAIIRSPYAVINSWAKTPKEFDPSWDLLQEWYYGDKKNENLPSHYFGFNKWLEATRLFIALKERFPEKTHLVYYDELISNTLEVVKDLFQFLNISLSDQTLAFLNQSTANNENDSYSVFKTKKNDLAWLNELPSEVINGITKALQENNLEPFIYNADKL